MALLWTSGLVSSQVGKNNICGVINGITVVTRNPDQNGKSRWRGKSSHSHRILDPKTAVHFTPSILQMEKTFGTVPNLFLCAEHILGRRFFKF
jgi:hypothetical protein